MTAILVVLEDGFAADAAIHQVIHGTRKLNTQRAGHGGEITKANRHCQLLELTTFQLLPQLQLGIGQEFLPRMSFSGHCRFYCFNNETEDFTKSLLDKPEAVVIGAAVALGERKREGVGKGVIRRVGAGDPGRRRRAAGMAAPGGTTGVRSPGGVRRIFSSA